MLCDVRTDRPRELLQALPFTEEVELPEDLVIRIITTLIRVMRVMRVKRVMRVICGLLELSAPSCRGAWTRGRGPQRRSVCVCLCVCVFVCPCVCVCVRVAYLQGVDGRQGLVLDLLTQDGHCT